MRFFILLMIVGVLAGTTTAIFRANQRGIQTVNMDSGDIEWVALPRDEVRGFGRTRCVFCRTGDYP